MKPSSIIFTFLLVVLLLAVFGDAKGSTTGWRGRAVGGGYYRGSKTGYYSRTNRYYLAPMSWRGGRYYSYRGPTFRANGVSYLTQEQIENAMCRRNVVVDTSAAATEIRDPNTGAVLNTLPLYGPQVILNSTQYCYEEKSVQPGAPENVPLEALMLSRFRFNISVEQYPQVGLVVYPDKDLDTVAVVNTTLRFRRLFVTTKQSSSSSTTTAPADSDILRELDLRTGADNSLAQDGSDIVAWRPCSMDACGVNVSGVSSVGSAIGRPSSRHMEGSRLTFLSVYYDSAASGIRVQLRFWLSDDFDEDNSYEHVLLMPNAMKVDVKTSITDLTKYETFVGFVPSVNRTVTPGDDLQGSYLGNNVTYLGVEALLSAPETGPGSTATYQATAPNRVGTDYNPQTMDRIALGTTTDISTNNAAFMSFATTNSKNHLCTSNVASQGYTYSPCVDFFDKSTTALNDNVLCSTSYLPASSTTSSSTTKKNDAVCEDMLLGHATGGNGGPSTGKNDAVVYSLKFYDQARSMNKLVTNPKTVPGSQYASNTDRSREWYVNLGYSDPVVSVQADQDSGASSLLVSLSTIALFAFVSMVL